MIRIIFFTDQAKLTRGQVIPDSTDQTKLARSAFGDFIVSVYVSVCVKNLTIG
jgi:hypothetical protein